MVRIIGIDHFVLTVRNIGVTVDFYQLLGMSVEQFTAVDGLTRWALNFGTQKINLHIAGAEFKPHAKQPRAGSADVCLLSDGPLAQWQEHLADAGIDIELGPVKRTGAVGPISSLYVRDPDGNLIEISTYD